MNERALDTAPMRIVHVTTVHRPFDVRIFLKQCQTLSQAGYDVALIQQGDHPTLRGGVRILPLPTYSTRFGRMTAGVWKATWLAFRSGATVVHFHDPEMIWGALLLKAAGRRVIYDVHEDVVLDLEDKHYLPKWTMGPLRIAVRVFEGLAGHLFDRVSTATSAISKRFAPERTVLIRNTPILGELAPVDARPFAERPPNAGYLGGLGALNSPLQMIGAMELVPQELGAKLVVAGRFPDPDLETKARALSGWRHVEYLGWIDRVQMPAVLGNLRCGLVVYQPTPNAMTAEPNKFFEYLSAGIPLIASDYPIWRALIEEFGCGLLVDPTDPASIAAAIAHLVNNPSEAQAMGERGRAAVLQSYNWSIDGSRLVEMYASLARQAA